MRLGVAERDGPSGPGLERVREQRRGAVCRTGPRRACSPCITARAPLVTVPPRLVTVRLLRVMLDLLQARQPGGDGGASDEGADAQPDRREPGFLPPQRRLLGDPERLRQGLDR